MISPFNRVPGTRVPLPQTMTCPVCNTVYRVRGYYRHLKACLPRHGLEFAAYERRFPFVSYSPWHAFAIQLGRLANFKMTRFGLGGYHGCDWFHVHADLQRDCYYTIIPQREDKPRREFRRPETKPLLAYENGEVSLRRSFYQFREHLRGDLTLGIWPDLDNRFLMIDLDGRQTEHLGILLERLRARGLGHHLEFSGSKGYHVWIFFQRVVPNALLIALYDRLCEGLRTDRNVWPFRRGLIKLPLGLHPKTRNVAGFLTNPKLPIPLEQQLDYFLSIRPVQFPEDLSSDWTSPPAPVWSDSKARPSRPAKAEGETGPEWQVSDEGCAELLRTNTRPEGLGRYYLLFRLCTYLKEIEGRSPKECRDALLAWSLHVSQTHRRTLAYDVERQVRNVFALRVRRACGDMPELTIEQRSWLLGHVEQVLADRLAAGHRLDRNHLAQARDALHRLAEYLVRLVLWRSGRAYASFEGISVRSGLRIKRIAKWLPLLCGEAESGHDIEDPARYRGHLLIRVGFASRERGLSQEYALSATAAQALLCRGSPPTAFAADFVA